MMSSQFLRKIILFAIGMSCLSDLGAQQMTPEILAAAGESRDIGQYNVSWTAGETAIWTLEDQGISMLQGFHQPDYFFDVKIIKLDPTSDFEMYPNPTDGLLNFKLPRKGIAYRVECFDISGKILLKQEIDRIHNFVWLKELNPGVYLLRLKDTEGRLWLNGLLVKI